MLSENEKLISVKEACEFLGIGHSTLYRHLKDPTFPIRRVGKRPKFLKSELLAWTETISKALNRV